VIVLAVFGGARRRRVGRGFDVHFGVARDFGSRSGRAALRRIAARDEQGAAQNRNAQQGLDEDVHGVVIDLVWRVEGAGCFFAELECLRAGLAPSSNLQNFDWKRAQAPHGAHF